MTVAAVELRPRVVAAASELQAFARQQPALRAPRRTLMMLSLPRNAQGKFFTQEIKKFLSRSETSQ